MKHGEVITRHPHLLSQPIKASEVISFALPVEISWRREFPFSSASPVQPRYKILSIFVDNS